MQELLPGEASQPARGQAAHVLRRLRLNARRPLALDLLICALSGAALSTALPPLDLGPVAFVAAAPFVWAVSRASRGRAVLCGWAFGIAYLGLVSSWVLVAGWLAWFALVVPFALSYGAFAFLVPALWATGRPVRTAAAVAAWWTVIEFIRGFLPLGGYTWGILGTTQHDNPLLLPIASITGVWGISFVVAFVNAAVIGLLERAPFRRKLTVSLLAAILATAGTIVPAIRQPLGPGHAVEVAIVQGNAPERRLFDRILEDRVVAENHARLHLTLSSDPPDLAVWPENSVDRDPASNPDLRRLIQDSVEVVGVPTLLGAITDAPGGGFYNENAYYVPGHGFIERYRKLHPVPFGEYVPFRERLGFIGRLALVPRDMEPGEGPVLFETPDPIGTAEWKPPPPFTSIICFENAFADLTRQAVDQGAGFLVVTTNNLTFQRSALSEQHVAWSQIRAAENGRWVVHAALTGISALVSPEGEVSERTELFEPAVVRHSVPVIRSRTLYTRLGDWFPLVAGTGVAAAFFLAMPARRRREPPGPLEPARILVILPTYQERDTIEEAIRRVLAADPRVDVLVVDDGSPDGTGEAVRAMGETEPRVRLIERAGKQGLASAYVAGFGVGLDEGYDVIVEMDADLSHQPEELPRLLDAIRDHDVVIGSRYVPGGAVTNWSRARVALSKGGNLYARSILRLPLRDATSGFRAFRREVLRDLIAPGISSDGYGFQVELAYRAWRWGYAVAEVPITFRERQHGSSKISRRIIVEAMVKVAGWAWRDRFRREP